MRVVPITNSMETIHVMTVKEAKTKRDECIFLHNAKTSCKFKKRKYHLNLLGDKKANMDNEMFSSLDSSLTDMTTDPFGNRYGQKECENSTKSIIIHQNFHSTLYRKVTLNVGGEKHDVLWSTLAKKPRTRLGKLAMALTHEEIIDCCDSYSLDDNEFFFNVQARSFKNILNFYQSGKLHMVDEMCCMEFAG